jgi:hypothetical protein
MTPEELQELRRRADALYRWEQDHGAAQSECPVCRGVRWVFRLEMPGPFVPRVCVCCGHVQLFDAEALGLEPAAPAEDERFEAVLAAYLEAMDAGWAPTREQFLACYPELAPELAAFFANADRAAKPSRPAPGVPPNG